MSISDYKIQAVIKVYLRNLKVKTFERRIQTAKETVEDKVEISEGAMKRFILERAKEKLAGMVVKHDKDVQ